jgi:phosphoribosylaminoimidazole-succinocarboxamide synthase
MQQGSQSPPLFESRLRGLKKIHQGKVRDIYDVDAEHLLIVTTDRLSAFDVVLPDPIPFKGEVLTQISLFWFAKTRTSSPTISPRSKWRTWSPTAKSARNWRAAPWW